MRLVYLSPVPWESFAQRPHKFIEWFHTKYQGDVLWVDPYPTRLPTFGDFRRNKTELAVGTSASTKAPNWLQVIRPSALPIEPFPAAAAVSYFLWQTIIGQIDEFLTCSESFIGIGKPSKLALKVLKRYPGTPSFYDAMDDFPAFYKGFSRRSMTQCEVEVADRVSNIMVSSTALASRFNSHQSKISKVLNACDAAMISGAAITAQENGPPVLGYVGTIGHWFDWGLVFALAETNPNARIRLVGPVYNPPPVGLPSNIELHPACDHDNALIAMQKFNIGLIPFMRTALTASVDPIKYYEYRALGLPVISSCFGEMAFREMLNGVFLVNDQSNLTSMVNQALAYEPYIDELRRFRKENSWEARFDTFGIFG